MLHDGDVGRTCHKDQLVLGDGGRGCHAFLRQDQYLKVGNVILIVLEDGPHHALEFRDVHIGDKVEVHLEVVVP
jgi:hypothetical protein